MIKNEITKQKTTHSKGQPKEDGFQPTLLTSQEFDETTYSRRWLVRSILLPD
jgi:hypothetical protein